MTNAYNYFHDFKKPVEYATVKIEILIENGRSLKLHQMHQVNALSLSSTTSTQQNWPQTRLPSLSESCREDQEWVERGWEWVGRRGEVEGCQVSTTTTTSITTSLTTIPTLWFSMGGGAVTSQHPSPPPAAQNWATAAWFQFFWPKPTLCLTLHEYTIPPPPPPPCTHHHTTPMH